MKPRPQTAWVAVDKFCHRHIRHAEFVGHSRFMVLQTVKFYKRDPRDYTFHRVVLTPAKPAKKGKSK